MEDVKKFAFEHPIITFLIVDTIVSGAIAAIRVLRN